MVKLVILCHPRTPVATADLEGWLEEQLTEMRSAAPRAIIRLSRLSQGLPDTQIEIGWLIELELEQDSLVDHHGFGKVLADAFTDMRFLGLQPSLFSPRELPPDLLDVGLSTAEGPVLSYPGA